MVKAQTLSPQAEISILTCSKGDDLYNTFGHTAIRLKDEVSHIDVVYNYGMFSFGGSSWKDQVSFGVKFARGKLEYWLGRQEYSNFLYSYTKNKRWVYEQTLNLTPAQKNSLFIALETNYLPENRAYRYDFFFDNCSSRVRDIIANAIGPIYGNKDAPMQQASDSSFIDLIDPYLANTPWLDFGMDVMLGLPSSKKASRFEFMFLPYHLKTQLSKVDGLVKKEGILLDYPDRPIGKRSFSFTSPFMVFSILFIVLAFLTYTNYKKKKHWFLVDRFLLFISGLLGCLFLFMWLGTNHIPTHANLNMFWAFPLNIIAFLFVKNKKWQLYFKITLAFSSFILLAWFLSPQQYHLAAIPIAGIYIIRYIKLLDWQDKN